MRKTPIPLAILAGLLLGLMILAAGAWGSLALLYAWPGDQDLRNALAAAFALATLLVLIAMPLRRWRMKALAGYLVLFAALLFWWSRLEPSNQREWQPDVAVLPFASIEGDFITVHNIRNFDYRSETDYTPAWYDKRFDLRKLQGVDLAAVYWMGPAIAHVFLSFDFGEGNHLAMSIETRKEQGEGYSTLKGFFRQYELYYVVADERDVIRLRTNYRHDPPEEVYLYRLQGDLDKGRQLFLEYMRRINSLHERPEFYNTLTTNCTTTIWMNTRVNPGHLPFDWRILASGYLPEFLYEEGRLDSRGLPFEELRRQVHVNARAQAADQAADFSRRIRAGMPPATDGIGLAP